MILINNNYVILKIVIGILHLLLVNLTHVKLMDFRILVVIFIITK